MGIQSQAQRGFRRVRERLTGGLNRQVRAHMGSECTPVDIRMDFPSWRDIDASVAALELFRSWGGAFLAFTGDAAELFGWQKDHASPQQSASFAKLEVRPGLTRQGLRCGLVLLHIDGEPVVAHCWDHAAGYTVRILAKSQATAERVLNDLQSHESTQGQAGARIRQDMATSMNARLRTHFGEHPPVCVQHEFASYLIPNATVLLHRFLVEQSAEIMGFGGGSDHYRRAPDLKEMMEEPRIRYDGKVEAILFAPPEVSEILVAGQLLRGLTRAVAVLDDGGAPVALCCFTTTSPEALHVWALAADADHAERFLATFLAYEQNNSILKGRLIRPRMTYRDEIENVEILEHEPVCWEDVIVPADIEKRVRDDIIEYTKRAETLRRTGLALKRGILLHGAPGTGKTLICRLLATELQGFTTIQAAGTNLHHPAAVFQLARRLAPALVVLEDVDLIGTERDLNGARAVLGSLLNELDGMGRQDQVIVVLTTNRLKVLEAALVDRPGRIDTVIGLPEPNAELRRRLIKHFAGSALMHEAAITALVDDTVGASPAFLRELMKRAVLSAPEPTDASPIVVDETVARSALAALLEANRDRSARRIIGFTPGAPNDGRGRALPPAT